MQHLSSVPPFHQFHSLAWALLSCCLQYLSYFWVLLWSHARARLLDMSHTQTKELYIGWPRVICWSLAAVWSSSGVMAVCPCDWWWRWCFNKVWGTVTRWQRQNYCTATCCVSLVLICCSASDVVPFCWNQSSTSLGTSLRLSSWCGGLVGSVLPTMLCMVVTIEETLHIGDQICDLLHQITWWIYQSRHCGGEYRFRSQLSYWRLQELGLANIYGHWCILDTLNSLLCN